LTLPKGASVEVVDTHRGDIHLLLGARTNIPELDRIAERADRDAAFKDWLLHDPRAAVEDHAGGKLPPTCTVHVREAAPNTIYLYLADSPGSLEELTDDALEAVSGGVLRFFACIAEETALWAVAFVNAANFENYSSLITDDPWA
jgi:hypothetical protein